MATFSQTLTTRYETKSWRQAGDAYGFASIDVWHQYTGFDNVVGRSEDDRNAALLILSPFTFSGRSTKLEITFSGLYLRPDSRTTTFRWSLCTSRANEALYKNAGAQSDQHQVATGTFSIAATGSSYVSRTISISTTAVPSGVPLYLYLSRESDTLGNFHFRNNISVTLTTGSTGRETPIISFSGENRIGSPLQIILTGAQSKWITTVRYSLPPSYDTETAIGTVTGNGTLNWSPVKSLANSIQPGSSSLVVHINITTTYDGAPHIAIATITLQPPNDLGVTISATANNTGTGIPSSTLFVKDVSRLHVQLNVQNLYGAQFARADIITNSGNFSLNSASGNSAEAIKVSGAVSVSATIYDTWGRSATVSTSINVLNYSPPTVSNARGYKYSSDPTHQDPAGTKARLTANASCTKVSTLNTVTVRYRKKRTSDATWGAWTTLASGSVSANIVYDITGLNANDGYQIEISAVDTIGKETTVSLFAPSAELIPLQLLPTAVGMGTKPTHSFALELNPAWEIYYKAHPILDVIYPVGSIYMSVNAANPATLFGGTWERIRDRFLLAAGDTYAAGTTGGSASVTLTVSEIPEHSHSLDSLMHWPKMGDGDAYTGWGRKTDSAVPYEIYATGDTGGGQAHNNMPPYLAVYVWRRTA